MALLLFLVVSPAPGQMSTGAPPPSLMPPEMLPAVEGLVSAVDGTVVTLLGSPLLRVDVSGATVLAADAAGGSPPPITPGAFILATVDPTPSPAAGPLPPPLHARTVAVRPAGAAVLSGEIQSVASDSFALLFRTILVDAGTAFSGHGSGGPVQGLSDLKPGMHATARVVAGSAGLRATMVVAFSEVVATPPPTPGRTFTFDGTVQSMPPQGTIGLWKIGDRNVIVNGLTRISGTPKVGSPVTVTGYAMPSPVQAAVSLRPSMVPIVATSIVTKP